jgi:anti-sigma28 factor (negative regulator of flagellin synthesis)
MRAEDQNLAQSQAVSSKKTSAEQPPGGGVDRLARALAASSSERASRVQQLAQAIAGGRYQADPRATASALVREAMPEVLDRGVTTLNQVRKGLTAAAEAPRLWGRLRRTSLLLYQIAGFTSGWARLRNLLRAPPATRRTSD